jgi:tRNA(His) guanylyltransferase
MAKSKYEYVKAFEQPDNLLPHCWIVIRVDGKGFTKFCDAHGFEKPNDARALHLMDAAALEVMQAFAEIRLAYGESDEYSFVFAKDSKLYDRRASKLSSLVVSLFSASYVRQWGAYFPVTPLKSTPCFDSRAVCYPSDRVLRDYLAWRQVLIGCLWFPCHELPRTT